MKPLSDARFAFLHDPDLYDLVGRLALKRVRDEAFAEDIRNGAYEVAMKLVIANRGPRPGTERGWVCFVARNHTFAEIRRKKEKEEPVLPTDEEPVLPVDDHQTVYEEQQRIEKERDAAEQVAESHRDQAALLAMPDGRTKQGADAAPKDAAARKRRERARTTLASVISAVVAAAIALLWAHSRTQPAPVLPAGAFANLADAAHELAHQSCAAQKWVACLEGLDELRALDASKFGPAEQGAWAAAVAGLRKQAFAHCTEETQIVTCLEELNTARRYDPAGDKDPTVTLARIAAGKQLQPGTTAPTHTLGEVLTEPDAKEVPYRGH